MNSLVQPLSDKYPLVKPDRSATPYFQRLMQQLLKEKAITDGLAETAIQPDDLAAALTALQVAIQAIIDALALDDLVDVDTTTTPPTDGQALIWDDANSIWVPGDVASGGGSGTFKGCRLRKTVAQGIVASSQVALTWDVEDFDTDGFHDNVTNNTRITIPTSLNGSYVEVTAALNRQFSGGNLECTIYHYSSVGAIKNEWQQRIYSGGWNGSISTTGPVQVATGDYFIVYYYTFAAGGQIEISGSCFALKVLAAPASVSTVVPTLASMTWLNQGTSTAVQNTGGIRLAAQTDGNIHGLVQAAPSAPFTAYMRVKVLNGALPANATYNYPAIILRNSSNGRLIEFNVGHDRAAGANFFRKFTGANRWTNPTTYSAAVAGVATRTPDDDCCSWLAVEVSATGVMRFYLSPDGYNWIEPAGAGMSENISAFLTAAGGSCDQIGFVSRTSGGDANAIVVSYFSTTAPA